MIILRAFQIAWQNVSEITTTNSSTSTWQKKALRLTGGVGDVWQVMRIVDNVRPDRQTVMFSATFPRAMEALARRILAKPIEVLVGGRSVVCSDVQQHVVSGSPCCLPRVGYRSVGYRNVGLWSQFYLYSPSSQLVSKGFPGHMIMGQVIMSCDYGYHSFGLPSVDMILKRYLAMQYHTLYFQARNAFWLFMYCCSVDIAIRYNDFFFLLFLSSVQFNVW